MEFKLSQLMYGFSYWRKDFPEIRVLCIYESDVGDLDSFVCIESDREYYETWYHDSVNIHEDDLREYLDSLIEKVSFEHCHFVKEL